MGTIKRQLLKVETLKYMYHKRVASLPNSTVKVISNFMKGLKTKMKKQL